MTARKRKLIIYTAIVVIFVLLEIFFCLSDSRNTKVSDTFHNLTARILREELMRDSLSLHYSFADAGVYGMDETAARFRFDPLPGQDIIKAAEGADDSSGMLLNHSGTSLS